jgi:hypothetical protein
LIEKIESKGPAVSKSIKEYEIFGHLISDFAHSNVVMMSLDPVDMS